MMNHTKQATIYAAAAKAEITPPLELGYLSSAVEGTYSVFESVRNPLYARVIVLKSASENLAIVSLDLLGLTDSSVGGWQNFKDGLSADGVKVIVTCTHTHSAPETVGLSDLYLTPDFRNWLDKLQLNVRKTIHQAAKDCRPCRLGFHEDELQGYSLQRRVWTPEGIVMSHDLQPVNDALMAALPVDRRVRTLCFNDLRGKTIARLVHAICHPVHEMCLPRVSADFPGALCRALDETGEGMALFVNGALGDTNPPTVSGGPGFSAAHGKSLAEVAARDCEVYPLDLSGIQSLFAEVQFSVRQTANVDPVNAIARFSALRLGRLALLFLPGEPFVEIAQAIERESPFDYTIIVALGENNIGYVPTAKAFDEGGYEIGPGKWSFLPKETDLEIMAIGSQLLEKLYKGETGTHLLSIIV